MKFTNSSFRLDSKYCIGKSRPQTTGELSISFFASKSLAADLAITLSLRAIIDSDIKILSKDEKFMRWLDENKKKFDDKYEELVKSV
jgi:hypothetical protein